MDKIQKAMIGLMTGKGIFYATLLGQMNRIEGKDVLPKDALAAVLVQNGRINLYTNCELYDKYNLNQMMNILEHECLHIIYEHGSRAPDPPDPLWNIATDLAINSLIPGIDLGILPGKAPFEKLPQGKQAEFYFGVLKDKQEKGDLKLKEDGVYVKDKKGKWQKAGNRKCPTAEKNQKSSDAESLAREVLKQAVEETMQQLGPNKAKAPVEIASVIEELLGKEKINWKTILRQYIGNSVKAGSMNTWKRPSRRFGEDQKGKQPERILEVGVAVDTSGSISDGNVKEFFSEMMGIMRSYKSKMHVVECSRQIDKTYDLTLRSKPDMKVEGRGEGDLRPVFEYFKEKRRKKPDVLVFFTDGYEQMPEENPKLKTLWVRPGRVADYPLDFPFGKVIQMPKGDDDEGACPACDDPGCNCNTAIRNGTW